MFASRSVAAHLSRGALAGGVFGAEWAWWLPFVLLPLGLVLLRGCPMCWTLGLVQTVFGRGDGACVDGTCTLERD